MKDKNKQHPFKTLTVDLCGPWPVDAMVEEQKEVKARKGKEGQKKKYKIVPKMERLQIWHSPWLTNVQAGQK